MLSAQIHCLNWNGGLSHVLLLEKEHVDIYHCLDQFNFEDKTVNEWLDTIDENNIAQEFPSFLEGVDQSFRLNDVIKSEVYPGAALFHCPNNKFIFVENTINEICLIDGDFFVKFVSIVGNSDVPESYIVGNKYTYILSSDIQSAFPNELFNDDDDVYYTSYETRDDHKEGIPFYFVWIL
jgi:hypothetical protein